MRFLVDAQLPPALARWLVAAGHRAEHVGDRSMAAAPDAAIWDLALAEASIIITKDEDFARRRALADEGPPWSGSDTRIRADASCWRGSNARCRESSWR